MGWRWVMVGIVVTVALSVTITILTFPDTSQQLWSVVQGGPGTVADFDRIAPFAWDRMFVFGPYTSQTEICDALGLGANERLQTSIESSDTVTLVVFTGAGRIVTFFDHPRDRGDLSDLHGVYVRKAARFVVDRDREGRAILAKMRQ